MVNSAEPSLPPLQEELLVDTATNNSSGCEIVSINSCALQSLSSITVTK